MIGNNPDLKTYTASGSWLVDMGALGDIEVEYEVEYATDNNSYARGDYKLTALIDPKNQVELDLTRLLPESYIDQILENHLF